MHNTVGMLLFWGLLAVIALVVSLGLVWLVNRRQLARGQTRHGLRAVGVVGLAVVTGVYFGLPAVLHLPDMLHRHRNGQPALVPTRLTYRDIKPIIDARCVPCHSRHPTNSAFPVGPMGLRLDTYSDLKGTIYQVQPLTVKSHIMPLYNMTGMTDTERAKLGAWMDGGAPE